MNPLEHLVEAAVGYPVDWNATGTWVTAIITAMAVFLAAILTDVINRRTERRHDADRLEVLSTVYGSVRVVLEEVVTIRHTGTGFGPGLVRTIDDLLAVLYKVPILELPGKGPAEDLVVVRRILAHVRDEVHIWSQANPDSFAYARAVERVREAEQRVLELAIRLR